MTQTSLSGNAIRVLPEPVTPVTIPVTTGNRTKRGRASDAAARIQEHYRLYPNMSAKERAKALNLHRSTITRHLNTVNTHVNA